MPAANRPAANGPATNGSAANRPATNRPATNRPHAAAPDPPPAPGLARERTALAWTRTAISFAAVGGVVLKREVIPGLLLLAVVPAIWQLGRLAYHRQQRLILLTVAVVAVAAVALGVSFTT